MDSMSAKMAAYEAEMKRRRDEYGAAAEVPSSPFGLISAGAIPVQPITARIADLSKQLAEAAHMLTEARSRYREARDHKAKCQEMFVGVSEELLRVIHEHREGTPEGVPYQS